MFRHPFHRHPRHPARAVALSITAVAINLEQQTMKVTLTWDAPTTRESPDGGVTPGAALALTEIAQFIVSRNGKQVASINTGIVATGNTFTDSSPLTGADAYTVATITTDNLTSKDSNVATVTITAPLPAAAITNLVATLVA